MANVKLKDGNGVVQTYNGVNKVVLKDTLGEDVVFEQAVSGSNKVTLLVDGQTFQIINVPSGQSIAQPTNPTKSGYVFIGWTTTSGGTTADVSFPYTVNNDVVMYAVFNTVIQLKASPVNYGTSTPSSVSFSTNANLRDWTPESVTQAGVNFIKIPTMYRKVVTVTDNQITSFIISSWKEDDNFVPYSCFIDESGNILPYVLIAKSWMSTSSTIGDGRTQARNKGTGYQLYDWQFQKLWQDLICAKMQKIDINSGSGITTDVLGLSWGSTYGWIDGVCYQGATKQWAICYKPSKYINEATASTTDYQLVGYASGGTSGQEIKKLGYDANHPFFNYPVDTVSNSSYNTYYCDSYYFGTSPTHPVISDVGRTLAYCGAFYCAASFDWSDTNGVRLCYRPLTA